MPLNENEFKALVYGNIYVDASMLEKGIYTSPIPCLYSKDTTMDKLIDNVHYSNNLYPEMFKNYLENLKKCKLITVKITK